MNKNLTVEVLKILDSINHVNSDILRLYKSEIEKEDQVLVEASNNLEKSIIRIAQKTGGQYEKDIYKVLFDSEDTEEEVSNLNVKYKPSDIRPFIVHGHDSAALFELKDLLQNDFGFQEPISLQQQAPGGKTLIELFEDYASKATVVFVLLTGDDPCLDESGEEILLPRQNVTFEFGYFVGALGRLSGKVIVLRKGKVKIPSDVKGWRYIDVTNGIKVAYAEIKNALTQTTIIK